MAAWRGGSGRGCGRGPGAVAVKYKARQREDGGEGSESDVVPGSREAGGAAESSGVETGQCANGPVRGWACSESAGRRCDDVASGGGSPRRGLGPRSLRVMMSGGERGEEGRECVRGGMGGKDVPRTAAETELGIVNPGDARI